MAKDGKEMEILNGKESAAVAELITFAWVNSLTMLWTKNGYGP